MTSATSDPEIREVEALLQAPAQVVTGREEREIRWEQPRFLRRFRSFQVSKHCPVAVDEDVDGVRVLVERGGVVSVPLGEFAETVQRVDG